jgi:hypothetical protein
MSTPKPKYTHQQMQIILSVVTQVIMKLDNMLIDLQQQHKNTASGTAQLEIDTEIMECKREMLIFNDIKIAMMRKMIEPKLKYSFKLKPYQELSFWLEFAGIMDVANYDGNMIQNICNNIHQKYA